MEQNKTSEEETTYSNCNVKAKDSHLKNFDDIENCQKK
jgi:hypothetical protein